MQLEIFDPLLFQFLGGLLEPRIVARIFLHRVVLDADLVDEMAAQIRFAHLEARALSQIGIGQLRDGDVGVDPAFLD